MSKKFIISLLDFAMGNELLEIQFVHITPEQMRAILEVVQGMMQNIIRGQGSYYDIVHHTVQQSNTLMAAYEDNTVVCRIYPGLTEAQIRGFIRLLDEETIGAEISTTAILEPNMIVSNQLRPYIHHVHHHYLLAVEIEPALRLNWADVLQVLQIPTSSMKQD